MSKIITRTAKGAAISQSENDVNLEAISGLNVLESGATYTVDIDDQNNTIEFTSAAAVAVTLDEIATIIAAANTSDFKVTLIAIGAGAVTITPDAADTINTGAATIVLAQNEYVTIQTDSTELVWNIINGSISGVVTVDATQTLTNKTLTSPKINEILDSNGNEVIIVATTASAVNEITLIPSATGSSVALTASGDDTDVGIEFTPKGAGKLTAGGEVVSRIKLEAAVDTTSGATADFIDIPLWAKKITIMLEEVSVDTTANKIFIQIGDSGGIEATGYISRGVSLRSTPSITNISSTSQFELVASITSAALCTGVAVLTLMDSSTNKWSITSTVEEDINFAVAVATGTKALSLALDRIQVGITAGAFDAGSINILIEG